MNSSIRSLFQKLAMLSLVVAFHANADVSIDPYKGENFQIRNQLLMPRLIGIFTENCPNGIEKTNVEKVVANNQDKTAFYQNQALANPEATTFELAGQIMQLHYTPVSVYTSDNIKFDFSCKGTGASFSLIGTAERDTNSVGDRLLYAGVEKYKMTDNKGNTEILGHEMTPDFTNNIPARVYGVQNQDLQLNPVQPDSFRAYYGGVDVSEPLINYLRAQNSNKPNQ